MHNTGAGQPGNNRLRNRELWGVHRRQFGTKRRGLQTGKWHDTKVNQQFLPQYDAYVVNTLKVDWSGAGSWTPEMVTVDITMDICCQNAGMGSASAGNPLTLDCDQAFCT